MIWESISFKHLTSTQSLLSSFLLAFIYVSSLYIWNGKYQSNRSESDVIRRKFDRVVISSVVSLVFIYLISQYDDQGFRLNEWIGIKFNSSFFKSVLTSLSLSIVLFSGPCAQLILVNYYQSYSFYLKSTKKINESIFINFSKYAINDFKATFAYKSIKQSFSDVIFLRNYFVAPVTEEFVFRSCTLPLLIYQLNFTNSILIAPAFFALAHLHHILEGYLMDQPVKMLIKQHILQCSYTWLFGIWSSYLFLRTGHFIASFVSHSFCNYMGFPDLMELFSDFDKKTRNLLILLYFSGLISFLLLAPSMTEPYLFNNKIFI